MKDLDLVNSIEKELIKRQESRAKEALKLFDNKSKNDIKQSAILINRHFYENKYSNDILIIDLINVVINSTMTIELMVALIRENVEKMSKKFRKHEKSLKWLAKQVKKSRSKINDSARMKLNN